MKSMIIIFIPAFLCVISLIVTALQIDIVARLCFYAVKDLFIYLTTGNKSSNLLAEFIIKRTYRTESLRRSETFSTIAYLPFIIVRKFTDPYRSPSALMFGYYVSLNIFGFIVIETFFTTIAIFMKII
ncbi:MAG: hypothetical protein ACRC92_20410 [Peptostreptococcaceae bacterium]